jgi:hypothetical protein
MNFAERREAEAMEAAMWRTGQEAAANTNDIGRGPPFH